MAIEAAIKGFFIENGIKQNAIGKKAGIAPAKLSLMLNGKQRMTIREYEAICRALNVPAEMFLNKEA